MLNLSNYNAGVVEGYNDYHKGFSREECPYSDDRQKWWLFGWDIAEKETHNDLQSHGN